ncbi:MAG: 3-deoxy-8-phosphooctulonate synthase [Proteobacteria bacterium]|nr:3-deoxy-8-phosphooctulonate synthase [Pseudomonadota bacterium]MBT5190424.1 3-deoxy-8-phosphooctulonate synthase [Pseudomonadota bacterium]MBT5625375.1 3-deoxy-8-phosphooctulonate synthase [Pseudomonadota bacterium]MBT6657040.1 3-deoxy-8-phosphooctulonate synthase [Pseudomonadota bacterium]MBT6931904.1 3-deoxy-8-phosphooctulonate synthase [Pseudomonadota bacterium]
MSVFDRPVGRKHPIFLIAGPCVIESRENALSTASRLAEIAQSLNLLVIYKSSFDKGNRSSGTSYRGPGLEEGLRILDDVRQETGLPLLTDVHTPEQATLAADVVDVLQTPAFLCRQTDLIVAAVKTGCPVNIKKGQFMAPQEMRGVAEKAKAAGGQEIFLCERGSSFGYHNLVVDMRSLQIMDDLGFPVVFDATHSVQLPGAGGDQSGGQREFVPILARAAVAAGVSGIFMETHINPDRALSDGPNAWPLELLKPLLEDLINVDRVFTSCQSFDHLK